MTKPTAHLEDWTYDEHNRVLRGLVSGHERQEQFINFGSRIRTSTVLDLNLTAKTAETRNTLYTLGEPYVAPVEETSVADA